MTTVEASSTSVQVVKPKLTKKNHKLPGNSVGRAADQNNEDPAAYGDATHHIILHSHDAQILWSGRKQASNKPSYSIMGCIDFSRMIRVVCDAALKQDDPYALYKLIEIERAHKQLDTRVSAIVKQLNDILAEPADTGLLYVQDFQRAFTPKRKPVFFASGYGYVSARSLKKFDRIVVLSLTAKNAALLSRSDQGKILSELNHEFRSYFELVRGFVASGASKKDLLEKNAKAKKAIDRFGELPHDVLTGEAEPTLLYENTLPS